MAVPQRKISKTRGRKRRTHYIHVAVATVKCPNCGEPKRPARLCTACGQYKGKVEMQVIEEATEDEEA